MLEGTLAGRKIALFDTKSTPSTWNERMAPGEYAVHFSSFEDPPEPPFCMVFGGLEQADAYARDVTAKRPAIRCRIYDHRGLVGAPLEEIRGLSYRGESELSSRFRRWVGAILFAGGLLLVAYDALHDFRILWPSMIGTRIFLPGLALLLMELVLVLMARRKETRKL